MVSFRNSQFQAILVGMVMTDAVSHGQLPWGTSGTATAMVARPYPAHTIAQADWCHAIVAALTAPSPHLRQSGATAAEPATVADLLADLPRWLSTLDQPLPEAALADVTAPPTPATISTIFYECLQASLRQDATTLHAVRQALAAAPSGGPPPALATGLHTALEALLTAQGDFQLAVGQHLSATTPDPGSLLLTAILSASWGDLPSVPTHYRHCLQHPSPPLQAWLQQRWHLSTGTQLALWAETLWQRWSGQYAAAPERSRLVAIQPLALTSNFASL